MLISILALIIFGAFPSGAMTEPHFLLSRGRRLPEKVARLVVASAVRRHIALSKFSLIVRVLSVTIDGPALPLNCRRYEMHAFSPFLKRLTRLTATAALLALPLAAPAALAQTSKPNILFIMGDDIGFMQPSIYHRGLAVGETPNIDRIGHEGAIFMTYYAEQSCTAGRNAFFTGMHPLRTGMIPPQLPGSPSYLRPGTPALA